MIYTETNPQLHPSPTPGPARIHRTDPCDPAAGAVREGHHLADQGELPVPRKQPGLVKGGRSYNGIYLRNYTC